MTDDLLRPLWSRVGEAGMNLAGFPVEQPPLRFDMSIEAKIAVGKTKPLDDVAVPVREQVVREALADASAYHVGGLRCDHLGEGALQPRVVFAASTTLCEYCTVQLMRGEGLEMPDDPPCDVCGAEVPVFVVKTQLSAEENAALYVACCCADCLRWWPTAHADIVSASASVGPRPVA